MSFLRKVHFGLSLGGTAVLSAQGRRHVMLLLRVRPFPSDQLTGAQIIRRHMQDAFAVGTAWFPDSVGGVATPRGFMVKIDEKAY